MIINWHNYLRFFVEYLFYTQKISSGEYFCYFIYTEARE